MRLLRHDNLADRIRRQLRLGQEPRRRTLGDEFRDIARRVGRYHDDRRRFATAVASQQLSDVKPALVPERQVDEDDVRPQLGRKLQSFSACRSSAEDVLTLPFKYASRNVSE